MLVTLPPPPPVAVHDVPLSSGSEMTGLREPQMTSNNVLPRLSEQLDGCAHSEGSSMGGALADQSVFSRP